MRCGMSIALALLVIPLAVPAEKLETTVDPAQGTRLVFPGKEWSVLVDLAGLNLDPVVTEQSPPRVKLSAGGGPKVSVSLGTAENGLSAAAYRDREFKALKKLLKGSKHTIAKRERDGLAIVESRIKEINGIPVDVPFVDGYLVHDGVLIEISLTPGGPLIPWDPARAEAILASVRVTQ